MPCYQPTNFPTGFTTTGRTSYTTEADCLNACREGACCEGTSCSVKPQCQCQGTGKVFKGVGTVCTGNCADCSAPTGCFCYCTSGGGTIPEYVNVTINVEWVGVSGSGCSSTVSKTATLTRNQNQPIDSIGFAGYTLCFAYTFPFSLETDGVAANVYAMKTSEGLEVLVITWVARNKACPDGGNPGNNGFTYNGSGTSFKTADPSGVGVCFARHSGATFSQTLLFGSGSVFPLVASVSVTGTVNGIY
jgi:hypothetical protein